AGTSKERLGLDRVARCLPGGFSARNPRGRDVLRVERPDSDGSNWQLGGMGTAPRSAPYRHDWKGITMRVFVAGASGVIGRRLVPQLVDQAHEVIGTCHSPGNVQRLHALGAEPVVLDLLDPDAVRKAVVDAKPEAIVHEATALTGLSDFKHFDRSFAQTNRLRTGGTKALLAAAREAGVRRFIAQSFASYRYARVGGPVKTEDDPLDPTPVPAMRETEAAMAYLDRAVTD